MVAFTPTNNRVLAIYVYGLQLLGLLLVFPPVIGLAINYATRERVRGTVYASHFDWQMRTFWWMLGWGLTGGALIAAAEGSRQPLFGIIGASLLLVSMVWFMYRILKGYIRVVHDRPMA